MEEGERDKTRESDLKRVSKEKQGELLGGRGSGSSETCGPDPVYLTTWWFWCSGQTSLITHMIPILLPTHPTV